MLPRKKLSGIMAEPPTEKVIGMYENGLGFGNISKRTTDAVFLISGTKTGDRPKLKPEHYAKVTDFSFEANSLTCKGKIEASSEALSHAGLYVCAPDIKAVIHIHHPGLFNALINKIPTTDPSAPPGTPEMALAIGRLYAQINLKESKLLVMGGHEPGLIAFGSSVEEARLAIIKALDSLNR